MTDNRTTELRRLLKERGVEYEAIDFGDACETRWDGFAAIQLTPNANLIMAVTPEQAVAATLGNGTCSIVKTWSDSDYVDDWRYRCSECGGFIPVNERDPDTGDVINAANYCPNCGKAVKR